MELKPCKFSQKYLETYRREDLKLAASKKIGSGKQSEHKATLIRVKWKDQQQVVTYHKDYIQFL